MQCSLSAKMQIISSRQNHPAQHATQTMCMHFQNTQTSDGSSTFWHSADSCTESNRWQWNVRANRELMRWCAVCVCSNRHTHMLMDRGGVVTFDVAHARSIQVGLYTDNVWVLVCVCVQLPTENLNESHTCLMQARAFGMYSSTCPRFTQQQRRKKAYHRCLICVRA